MSDRQLAELLAFEEIIYPDSDGKPMADNTKQFDWITNIVQNLRTLFHDDPNVFVAGDLLWYPVEGNNKIRRAPDAMVVFGRPKHHRGSYKQWLEDDIAPQVVFEIRSPGNSDSEMEEKFQFYQKYQVEEYYLYDPDNGQSKGWIRAGNQLYPIVSMNSWNSPNLGIHFELQEKELRLYHPDGKPFTSHEEEAKARLAETQRANQEAEARLAEKQRAEQETKARLAEKQRAEVEKQRAEQEAKARLAEKHRADEEVKARLAETQRANAALKQAEKANTKLARLEALLAQKGISLDDDDILDKL